MDFRVVYSIPLENEIFTLCKVLGVASFFKPYTVGKIRNFIDKSQSQQSEYWSRNLEQLSRSN